MRKIILLVGVPLALVLIFFAFIVLAQPHNTKFYDNRTRTVVIHNPGGQHLANLTLLTPTNHKVIRGDDRKVWEIEIIRGRVAVPAILNQMRLFDRRRGNAQIERDVVYKYDKIVGIENITEHGSLCNPYNVTYANQTIRNYPNCTSVVIGSHLENITEWTPLGLGGGSLPRDRLKIAMFTDVAPDEEIEWIPTFFGLEITEWATWTENFNTGLLHYYSLENLTTSVLDNTNGSYNGTILSGDRTKLNRSAGGIIKKGILASGDVGIFRASTNVEFNAGITMAIWVNYTNESLEAQRTFIDRWEDTESQFKLFYEPGAINFTTFVIQTNDSGVNTSTTLGVGYGLPRHEINWSFIVGTYDGSTAAIYINGTKVAETSISGDLVKSNEEFYVGIPNTGAGNIFAGSVDEIAIWSRGLTSGEVSDLYNNHLGLAYLQNNSVVVSVVSPVNDTFHSTPIDFICSASSGITVHNVSLYGNWSGGWHLNETQNYSGFANASAANTSVVATFLNKQMEDGFFRWGCFAETNLSSSWSDHNFTFTTELTNPVVSILNIGTTQGSQTFTFNVTSNDTNIDTCWRTVYNSSGGIDLANTTIPCGQVGHQATVTLAPPNSFNLTVSANDTAGNFNSSTQEFNITTLPGGPGGPGGGGGGGLPPDPEIPVIGLQEIEGTRKYDDLERMIIYAVINNLCSERIAKEPLAIQDFSGACSLKNDDATIIAERVSNFDVPTETEDAVKFFQNYKDRKIFQGFTTKENIDKYGLFPSVLGLVSLLQITPPSIDTFVAIFEPEGVSRELPFRLTSNKPVKSCEVISETMGLTCEVNEESNLILDVNFALPDSKFFTRVFTGTILVTTDVEDQTIVEQRRVRITPRVINFGFNNIHFVLIALVGGVLIVGFVILRVRRKGKRSKLKEILDVG